MIKIDIHIKEKENITKCLQQLSLRIETIRDYTHAHTHTPTYIWDFLIFLQWVYNFIMRIIFKEKNHGDRNCKTGIIRE